VSGAVPEPARRSRRPGLAATVGKYAPLVLGICVCLAAGWFELGRARAGREIAWVYVFEWPFYAVAGSLIWWQVWHPLHRVQTPRAPRRGEPVAPDDEGLLEWQRYLERLDLTDPPGGPPER
jgi:hypothetical protein